MPAKPSSPKAPQTIEWVLAAASAVVVLALFCFLTVEAITRTGQHPDIRLQATQIRELDGRFYLDIAVTNRGHAAAADIEIEGATGAADGAETAQVTLNYAPPNSRETVTLGFGQRIGLAQVELAVIGFREP